VPDANDAPGANYPPEVEALIAQWRASLEQPSAVHAADADELEGHLRDQIADLVAAGLAADEALLVAVKRMGSIDSLSGEFAQEHPDRLWKRLALGPSGDERPSARSDFWTMIGFACAAARVVYIKLVPLTDAEIADWRADQTRSDTRRLFAHNDAHFPHYQFRLTTPGDVRSEFEPYHESDFSRMYWEAGGGDLMSYFTAIGRRHTLDGLEDYGRRGDRLHADSWRVFRDEGVDPFEVALAETRAVGLEFHACYRVAGFHYPPPLDHHNHGDTYFQRHPEFYGEDRVGNRTPRISYSYPEVREFVVSLLREIAERPIDGVCLLYNRRPPLVEYEPPLVDGFTREFGCDPRTLPEDDPDWLAYRAATLTQFMRDVRAAMDEASRGRQRRLAVSAIVAASEAENLMQGIDVAAWVREDLVDTLIPYSARTNFRPFFNEPGGMVWTDSEQLEFLVETVADSPCVVAPNVMPRSMPPEDYRRQAATIYGAGAEHLFFWDSAGGGCRANFGHEWNALRRLGHVDEIQAWIDAGEPELPRPSMPLREWAGWDLSYVTPG